MKMTKDNLVALLQRIADEVSDSDSLQGSLNYDAFEPGLKPDEFEVSGAIRVDNRMGQGSVCVIPPSEKSLTKSKISGT